MKCLNVNTQIVSTCLCVDIKNIITPFVVNTCQQTCLNANVCKHDDPEINAKVSNVTMPVSTCIKSLDKLSLNVNNVCSNTRADINRVDNLNAECKLVCGFRIVHNYFLVTEGIFILSDGKKFEVINDGELSE